MVTGEIKAINVIQGANAHSLRVEYLLLDAQCTTMLPYALLNSVNYHQLLHFKERRQQKQLGGTKPKARRTIL